MNMDYEEWASHFVPVIEARHVRDYTVWVRFKDGVEGEADLSDLVQQRGELIEPLRNIDYFKSFTVNDATATIEWPNGCDLSPESLHLRVLGLLPSTRPV